jgi:hypothetical protein
VETGCRGGQGSPRPIAPTGRQAGSPEVLQYSLEIFGYFLLVFALLTFDPEDGCHIYLRTIGPRSSNKHLLSPWSDHIEDKKLARRVVTQGRPEVIGLSEGKRPFGRHGRRW